MTKGHLTMDATGPLVILVGLAREARIARGLGRVVIGAAGLLGALEGARGVMSFGVCGALDPSLGIGDLVVADGVVGDDGRILADAAWTSALRAAIPEARRGDVAAGQVIVGSTSAKAALRLASGAAIVDMESHAVGRAARERGLPFAVLRAVSDSADRALPSSAQAGFRSDGQPDIAAVIRALARRPWEIGDLIRTALDAERAFRSLERAARYSAASR